MPQPTPVFPEATSFRPIWSGQLELTSPDVPDPLTGADGSNLSAARLLVRAAGTPIGFLEVPSPDGRVNLPAVLDLAAAELGERAKAALSDVAWSTVDRGPLVSVVICTHNRAEGVRLALESVLDVRYANLEIIVVDNAPRDEKTREVVEEIAARDSRVRYLREPLKGLSRARNRALAEASGEFVAFTDDDVEVDALWVQGVLRGFARRADVACVTGLVASASLEQLAEQYFDRRVWWSSSCDQRLHVAAPAPGDSPFHPYTSGAFGTGANVACRADVLRKLGGFDQCLGPGTLTRAGEDLDIFVRFLRAGYAIDFEPSALIWHHHRVDDVQLRDQMHAYGLGLTAYLTKLALAPGTRYDMLRRAPGLVRHALLLRRRARSAELEASPGVGLARAEMSGMLAGPFAYLRARRLESRQHLAAVAH